MGLETGTYIKDLVSTNPTPTDPKSQGDDHLRLIKSTIQNSFPGSAGAVVIAGADGGVADAYTLTPTPALPSYTTKAIVVFIPNATNATTTPTLNISGLGAVTIVGVDGNALSAGDLVAGHTYEAIYNGTNFVLRSTVPIDSPALKGVPTAPTAATGTNNTQIATTAFAMNMQSPSFSGIPTAPTAAPLTDSTVIATTAYADAAVAVETARAESVEATKAPLNSPTFTGTVTIPVGASISGYAPLNSPALSGTPTAPTPATTDNSTKIATTAFAVQLAFQTALPAQAGNAGKLLTTDGTTASFGVTIGGVIVSTSQTVVPGVYYADTSGGPITLTLSATLGGAYTFIDPKNAWGTNNLTIAGNGHNIGPNPNNVAANFVADVSNYQFSVEDDSTYWRLV